MDAENKNPGSAGFHYHYGADGTKQEAHASKTTRELLQMSGRAGAISLLAFGGILGGSMLLIACMMLGCGVVLLGGGAFFSAGIGSYWIVNGIRQLMAGAFTGLGVMGFGLVSVAASILFAWLAVKWVRRVIPTAVSKYRTFHKRYLSQSAQEEEKCENALENREDDHAGQK